MGCFNIQDAITKNSITYGTAVKFMFISKVENRYNELACYITDNWCPISTIFDAEYNDYGSVENVKQSDSLKVFEEHMRLDIDQILEIISNNSRSPYNSCSPIMKIYRPDLSKDFHSYRTEVSIDNICKLSNKFEIINETKLKYTESDNLYYTFDFDFEKFKVNINQYNFDYNNKQFNLAKSYDINFQYDKHIAAFFEKVYEKTKFLFLFDVGERLIIEKLLNAQLFVFTETCFNYIMETKMSKNSRDSVNKKLQELQEMYNKINETTDEDSKERLEWNLEDKETLHRCIPSNHYKFKRVYDIQNLIKISEEYTNFSLLMNFMYLLNIEVVPSNYASQETFRKEEADFHKFCSQEAKSKYKEYQD